MDEKFQRLEKKIDQIANKVESIDSSVRAQKEQIDKMDEKVDAIEKTLVRQHEQLAYHIKRTDLAEENMDQLRKEFKPVEDHVKMMNGVAKAIAIAAAVAGIVKVMMGL